MSPPPADPPVPAHAPLGEEVVQELERLAAEAEARPDERDLHQRLAWLVDLLVARGQLTAGHQRIFSKIRDSRQRVRLSQVTDKRDLPSPEIDCAARLPLCKGRCCSFSVSLSVEDLREGKLAWDLEDPYVLRRDPSTRYCEHLERDGGCSVYSDRPATCRTYDCRNDPRVWVDFEARLPAPLSMPVVPLDEWPD